ncbi:hypothetical protein AB0A73_09610 [Glycomyces sp. NPDC047369]
MAVRYREKTGFLIGRYEARVSADFAGFLRRAFAAGEWSLAATELACALVNAESAVSPADKELFKELLTGISIPPDVPSDIADRLTTTD